MERLEYDFKTKIATAHIEDDTETTTILGAVMAIDPDADVVCVVAGYELRLILKRSEDGWDAREPNEQWHVYSYPAQMEKA